MKRILVLGAGFGGLRVAVRITKWLLAHNLAHRYETVLIDRSEYQTFTPLLYEIAGSAITPERSETLRRRATHNTKSLIGKLPITFLLGEVKSVDLMNGDVHLSSGGEPPPSPNFERAGASRARTDREIIGDFVVLALGSEVNYYDIPGLTENSLPLKTLSDALKIREVISQRIKTKVGLRVVVGGAGATGVEFAAQLKFSHKDLHVAIVEALPTALPGMHPKVIGLAQKRLEKLGVQLMLNAKISSVAPNEIVLENGGKMPFDVFVWSGGIKAPGVLSQLPLHAEPNKRPIVAGGMECLPQTPDLKLYAKVYGLGDSVCFYDPITKRPLPAIAPAATAQADIVAHNIVQEIAAAEIGNWKLEIGNYKPKEYPYVIPVGGKYAVAKIGPFIISGFFGWILKGLIELRYLLSIMPFARATRTWLKGL